MLLDSHILIWYADGDSRLGDVARAAIQSERRLYFSAASVWELTLKMHTGKLPKRDVLSAALRLGCTLLPVTAEEAAAVVQLPRHHLDPFDHLLLVQAQRRGLTLMTHDKVLARYDVPILLV